MQSIVAVVFRRWVWESHLFCPGQGKYPRCDGCIRVIISEFEQVSVCAACVGVYLSDSTFIWIPLYAKYAAPVYAQECLCVQLCSAGPNCLHMCKFCLKMWLKVCYLLNVRWGALAQTVICFEPQASGLFLWIRLGIIDFYHAGLPWQMEIAYDCRLQLWCQEKREKTL